MISNDSHQSNTSDKKVNSNYNSNSSTKHKRKESKMKQVNIEKFSPIDYQGDYDGVEKGDAYPFPFSFTPHIVSQGLDDASALGVWVYFQSLPPDWTIRKKQVMNKFNLSERAHKSIMAKLNRCNLITYRRHRNEAGHFVSMKVVVLSGKDFLNDDSTTGCKNEPMDKKESIHRCENHTCGKPPVWKTTPLTDNIDLKDGIEIKETTTTKTIPESSSSSLDVSPLHKYGFTDLHKDQMEKIDLPNEKIQESILSYAKALEDKSCNPNNPIKYFMGPLRKGVIFAPSCGPILKDQKESKARQEATQRLVDDIINGTVDPKYGVMPKCSEIPNS